MPSATRNSKDEENVLAANTEGNPANLNANLDAFAESLLTQKVPKYRWGMLQGQGRLVVILRKDSINDIINFLDKTNFTQRDLTQLSFDQFFYLARSNFYQLCVKIAHDNWGNTNKKEDLIEIRKQMTEIAKGFLELTQHFMQNARSLKRLENKINPVNNIEDDNESQNNNLS